MLIGTNNPRTGSRDSLGNYADPKRGAYVCPAGKLLTPIRYGDLKKVDYGNPKACRDCLLRARCTKDIRSVSRLENEGLWGAFAAACDLAVCHGQFCRPRSDGPDVRPALC